MTFARIPITFQLQLGKHGINRMFIRSLR